MPGDAYLRISDVNAVHQQSHILPPKLFICGRAELFREKCAKRFDARRRDADHFVIDLPLQKFDVLLYSRPLRRKLAQF
ncbi:MAG: hypothetical protein ACK519_01230 [Sphingomonadaceae bacterium]